MNCLANVCGIAAAAVGLMAFAPGTGAQENMDIFACQYIGGGPSEPLGDRDGHALRLAQFSCLASAGPLSGGVLTGATIYELDKGQGFSSQTTESSGSPA